MQQQNSAINDNTKLVRFLNLYGAEKTVGVMEDGTIHCTHHYGSLIDYQTLASNAGDSKEGSTAINLGNGIVGSDTTGNNVLVSCWSIWDGQGDPWQAFVNSSFTQNPDNICAVVSTVGKVKRIFDQTITLNQELLGNNFHRIVFRTKHGPVIYYPREYGVDSEHWEKISDPVTHGIASRTENNIFHKRDGNSKGQNYSAEKEYRFAMILSIERIFGNDRNIALNVKDAILRDYPLILLDGKHYIDEVYLRVKHPAIEITCFSAKIPLVMVREKNFCLIKG